MKGNFQVRFLGEGVAVMPLPYPTIGVVDLLDLVAQDISNGFTVQPSAKAVVRTGILDHRATGKSALNVAL